MQLTDKDGKKCKLNKTETFLMLESIKSSDPGTIKMYTRSKRLTKAVDLLKDKGLLMAIRRRDEFLFLRRYSDIVAQMSPLGIEYANWLRSEESKPDQA